MRKLILIISACLTILGISSCQDEYWKKIEDMESRIAALQEQCNDLNASIYAVQSLVSVIQSMDMITGLETIEDASGNTIGYKIKFVNNTPITIYNGSNGLQPLIGSKRYSDGSYYWTIQYGSGRSEWIKDSFGEMVPSIGKIPTLVISDGKWMMSIDGVNWTELGPADGSKGDSMFQSVDTSNPDYVIFRLADGSRLTIPRYSIYESVMDDLRKTNSNMNALKTVINSLKDSALYIKTIKEIKNDDGVKTGTYVELSNGENFSIYDWLDTDVPNIWAKMDTDKKYYWAIQYGEMPFEWILDDKGNKVPAEEETADLPEIGVAKDTNGFFYWTIKYGDEDPVFITDSLGNRPKTLEEAKGNVFTEIDNSSEEYLILKTKDATYRIPKEYTIFMSSDPVYMSPGETKRVKYSIYGALKKHSSIAVVAQGGFKAYKAPDEAAIEIVAPDVFESGVSQVMVIFRLSEESSRSTTRFIDIIKEQP